MAGAFEGLGPRHRGPGAAAGGGCGLEVKGGAGGSLSPTLARSAWHETQESWSWRGTQWEVALSSWPSS